MKVKLGTPSPSNEGVKVKLGTPSNEGVKVN